MSALARVPNDSRKSGRHGLAGAFEPEDCGRDIWRDVRSGVTLAFADRSAVHIRSATEMKRFDCPRGK